MAFPTYLAYSAGGASANQTVAPNLQQIARGVTATFEIDFFEDAPVNSIPAVPSNPALYPAWVLVDPSGIQIGSGVGVPGSSSGRWQTAFSFPTDAALSTQKNKYTIIWTILTGNSRQLQNTISFDIIELRTPATLQEVRSRAYITYAGESERVIMRFPKRPDMLTVYLYAETGQNNPVPLTSAYGSGSLADGTIVEVQEANLFTYYWDTPALNTLGQYQLVWRSRLTATSPVDTIIQQVIAPVNQFWDIAKSLRLLIDKLQKRPGKIQAYLDSDLYDYCLMAIRFINSVTPFTGYDFCSFGWNSPLVRFLIEGAAWYALQAQGILQSELSFAFSGQTVTLDLPDNIYDSAVQRLQESLLGTGPASLLATKREILRNTSPAAFVGGRLRPGYGAANNFVYSLGRGTAGRFPSFFGPGGCGFNTVAFDQFLSSLGLPGGSSGTF